MSDAAAWVGAGGTIAAVVVALFPPLRQVAWRPRIVLGHDEAAFNVRREPSGTYVPHGYARLRLRAWRRQPGAEGLQVSLLRCWPPARLGGREELQQKELRVALRWAYVHEASIALHPGAVRYVDIYEIRGDQPAWARLALQRGPPEGYYLPPSDKDYVLEVEIAGPNYNAKTRYIVVQHRGSWDGSSTFRCSMDVARKVPRGLRDEWRAAFAASTNTNRH
jgi:hypothetical protein